MFDDPKKELQRLQEQLLKEDEWFEGELEEVKALIGEAPRKKKAKPASQGEKKTARSKEKAASREEEPAPQRKSKPKVRNYANGYGEDTPAVRNTETEKPRKGIRGLVILAILETLGIVGVVAYWILFLL